jgi:hypothetical protein
MQIRIVIRWRPIRLTGRTVGNTLAHLQCCITGHEQEMVVRDAGLALRCTRCGWVSPGWQLDGKPPLPR